MKPLFSFNYDGKRYTSEQSFPDGLNVSCECKLFPEYDAVHWILTFENTGSENSKIISDILDLDMLVEWAEYKDPFPGHLLNDKYTKVVSMTGCIGGHAYRYDQKKSATEFSIRETYLTSGEKFSSESEGGRSSNFEAPFFRIAQEDEGVFIAIGWSGNWKADFERIDDGITVKAGLRNARFYLKPGEKVRTASILLVNYNGGAENGYNKFRRVIKSYFSLPAAKGKANDGVTAFEFWGGLPSDESVRRINKLKEHDIKYDYLWMDAGWYGYSTECISAYHDGWAEYTGHWDINPHAHPDMMKDIRKACDEAGMKILLWFEPERAANGSKMTVEHPEWFTAVEEHCLLNFGNEDAWQYMFDTLCHYLDDLPIDAVLWDANMNYERFWRVLDEEDRLGIAEIKHIMGFYRMYDELYKKYPNIIIDNCSSGGRRIDIETLSRSIMFCRSDYLCVFNLNPEVVQTQSTNISKFLPYTGTFCKVKNDTYTIRSCYQSNIGFAYWNAIFQEMNDTELEWAKGMLDEFRKVYHYFAYDFYNHGADIFDPTSWCIWQYNSPEKGEGMILSFRREASPFGSCTIDLSGLDDDAQYEFFDFDSKESFVMDGKAAKDFTVSIENKRDSRLITYKKI